MIFDNLTILDWTLLGALVLLFVVQVYWYSRYMAAPARRMRKEPTNDLTVSPLNGETLDGKSVNDSQPGVSVILCAHNEGDNLAHYLQALLTQDYPTYEVIVVNDGSEDDTQDVIDRYMVADSRLHTTFVPRDARVRSTKKLGLTLAAKAAQYDYLLLTDADCRPESRHWISEMMAGFNDQLPTTNYQLTKDVVLGFGAYFYQEGHINRLVRYDTLFNGLHYLGAALCGHPYMGVGRNLAYRKQLFFESGGFSRLMNNRAGDDDLFVNQVATRENTAVVLSRDSYTWSVSKTNMRDWWLQKRRHVSVSPSYKSQTKFRLALEPMTRGLFYALVLFMAISYWPVAIGWSIPFLVAIGLFLVRWLMQTLILNVSARRMGLHSFSMFTVLWFDVALPLVNLWMLAVPRKKLKW